MIQRWKLGKGIAMFQSRNGAWVRRADHEAVVNELMEALALACHEVEEIFGTCPNDQFDWEGPNCTNETCRDIEQTGKCWCEYYIAKAKGEVK